MKTEEWRVVEGYEGIYAISDAGNVMSMNYKASGLPGVMTPLTNSRYARVYLYKRGIDGDPFNNALENFEYCTKSHNMKHAFRTGLQSNRGENHSRAILTDAKVLEVRAYLAAGMKQVEVAKLMGLRQSVISRVHTKARWGHVPDKEQSDV